MALAQITMRAHALSLTISLLIGFLGCSWRPTSSGPKTQKHDLNFMAGFKPQAQLAFAAVYVAQEEGYFSAEGIDVTIRHSNGEHMQLLAAGSIDVATSDAGTILKLRSDSRVPLKSIALVGQYGQQAFASLKSSDIATPREWTNRTLGYKITVPPEFYAILDSHGIEHDSVKTVRVGFDPRVLTEGTVDILAVFNCNEPDTLTRLGHPIVVWSPRDYGIEVLGLSYVTTDSAIASKPDALRRFVHAAIRGVEFCLNSANEDRVLDIVGKFAPNEDREHMRYMLTVDRASARSKVTDEFGLGWMTTPQWQSHFDILRKHGAILSDLDLSSLYTTVFLPSSHPREAALPATP